MPIQGFTRFRKWQFGKQAGLGPGDNPTRRIAWRGVPDPNLNWTDQTDVDTGSIDPVLLPYRPASDITVGGLGGPLTYADIPILMAAGLRGGVTPTTSGSSRQWDHTGLSTTATTLDYMCADWSDDVTGDGFRFYDGVVESMEFAFDESLGPWTVSADWRFGTVLPGTAPVASLAVGSNFPLVFGADTKVYIDSTAANIGTTPILNALHSARIRIENTIDVKRFAQGSNTRFAVSGYGLSARNVTASFTFAKTDDIVAALTGESAKLFGSTPTVRFVRIENIGTTEATGGVPYSWSQFLAGTWRTRTDEDLGGNSVVRLDMTAHYDSVLNYAYRSLVVNQLTALP